jgi:hypothetical protein
VLLTGDGVGPLPPAQPLAEDEITHRLEREIEDRHDQ